MAGHMIRHRVLWLIIPNRQNSNLTFPGMSKWESIEIVLRLMIAVRKIQAEAD